MREGLQVTEADALTQREVQELDQRYVMSTYGRLPYQFERGEGLYLWDAAGRRYMDFLSGIGVNSVGHCHPRVVAAIRAQAGRLLHVSNLYYIEPQVRLAARLARLGLAGGRSFFCNSGAEAMEAAIKLARRYGRSGGADRYEIIAFERSFHGRTMGALTATGQPAKQAPFKPLVGGVHLVPFNDLEAVRSKVNDTTCAILVEAIQGEGGIVPAAPGFLQGLRRLCDRHDLLLICDEVQSGIGRTGTFFAFEHDGVLPDAVAMAKALGGGVAIGALQAHGAAADAFQPGDHASTFGGNPLACAAANAALQVVEEEGLVARAARLGQIFSQALEAAVEPYPFAGPVRGRGLMLGLVIDEDAAGHGAGGRVAKACHDEGLLCLWTAGQVLRFLPPLIVTEEELITAADIVKRAMEHASVSP